MDLPKTFSLSYEPFLDECWFQIANLFLKLFLLLLRFYKEQVIVSMFVGSKPLDFKKKIYYCQAWKWLGPGGPPGLQIQWRAENVRGGFDSHALPPHWVESPKKGKKSVGV